MTGILWIVGVVLAGSGSARSLRVAQREHYEPWRVTATGLLWCRARRLNGFLLAAGAACAVWGILYKPVSLGATVLALWPLGMPFKGTSKRLRFTPRLRRVLALVTVMDIAISIAFRNPSALIIAGASAWILTDTALFALRPIETALGNRFVVRARERLRSVSPRVIAITGSYGKTSTKLYVAHILSRRFAVVASPASFNNRMGLSTTVNQQVRPGVEIFVAEMGTYGEGEIRALCEIFSPEIAAITTIGEAHLERMKDRATIVRAKSEITERASTVILNVDVPEIAQLAERLASTKRVISCSAMQKSTDVAVIDESACWAVYLGGRELARVPAPPGAHPINLATAIGIASSIEMERDAIRRSLTDLPNAPHRAEMHRGANDVLIIDDTYNSNPIGAERALLLAHTETPPNNTTWTITPGMVELGHEQVNRNRAFAAAATAAPNMTLVITGRTNRRALLSGARSDGTVRVYKNRNEAAHAVLQDAAPGDVVLYENDLPDHYP